MEKNIKEFVETWIIAVKNGHTTTDIKEALSFKMTESKISNRASYLRKLGFNLPRLNPGMKARKRLIRESNIYLNKILLDL